jgi:hypothetical protein
MEMQTAIENRTTSVRAANLLNAAAVNRESARREGSGETRRGRTESERCQHCMRVSALAAKASRRDCSPEDEGEGRRDISRKRVSQETGSWHP